MLPFALLIVALLLLTPSAAAADGLPAVGIDANPLSVSGGTVEYVTKRAGKDTRLIERARSGGPVRERRIEGSFSIPAVAYDGSAAGLSANGRRLVLISPRTRFPRRRTTFAVLDARHLALRRLIHLRGDFSFDAIAPDGRRMYLIQYTSRNLTDYAVRAYDLHAGRLLRRPIVDPSEPDEEMRGAPVTRETSADGRWAYTLYHGIEHPFVHALDTKGNTAVCIDLDDLRGAWGSTLELRGTRLEVVRRRGGVVRATIDTRTHTLIEPAARRTEQDAGTSWLPIAAPTIALLLLGVGVRRRILNSRRSEPITEVWEPSSDQHAPTA
jgi:hypothetical protein